MSKIAVLALRLVALLLFTPLCYFVAGYLAGDRQLAHTVGMVVAFLPPLAVAGASMLALHRAFFLGTFSTAGRVAFHVTTFAASMLLTVAGVLIATAVQIMMFGE